MDEIIKQHLAHRGFTLIEILIVLILIALIAGISTVYFVNTLPKARQSAAAREIVSTIKYARHLAALKNERQVVTFDLDAGSYGLRGRAGRKIPDETYLVIYESGINADPIHKGQYSLYYDSTGANNWDRISLIRGKRTVRIDADPLLAAVIAADEQDDRHD
ncbi:MAG: prepilin-type N-terminal cleavage/methylation domain-containing protein [Deltaproteobacteria bacterium]